MERRQKEPADSQKQNRLLSINEVAKRLGVCRKTVENLIKRKELKAIRVGRRVLVSERDLEDFIRRRRS